MILGDFLSEKLGKIAKVSSKNPFFLIFLIKN